MPDSRDRMPQMNIRIPEATRKRAVEIARIRDERDAVGSGLSVVVRRAVEAYVNRYGDLLDDPPD